MGHHLDAPWAGSSHAFGSDADGDGRRRLLGRARDARQGRPPQPVEEIKEILLQTAIYCSVPAANVAFKTAKEALAEYDTEQ